MHNLSINIRLTKLDKLEYIAENTYHTWHNIYLQTCRYTEKKYPKKLKESGSKHFHIPCRVKFDTNHYGFVPDFCRQAGNKFLKYRRLQQKSIKNFWEPIASSDGLSKTFFKASLQAIGCPEFCTRFRFKRRAVRKLFQGFAPSDRLSGILHKQSLQATGCLEFLTQFRSKRRVEKNFRLKNIADNHHLKLLESFPHQADR